MEKYVHYDSLEAAILFQEFETIPNNPLSFELPHGFIVTSKMMHTFILAAHNAKGESIVPH